MTIMPIWYLVLSIVSVLVPMLIGLYFLYRRQDKLLQVGQQQNQQLKKVERQTAIIPSINWHFKTPQYLAQFTVTLHNARSTVLVLRDIIFVTVEKKTLQFHTKDKVYTMEGTLIDMVEGENPFLPYPLFVRVQKSYIINVLAVIESKAKAVYLSKLDVNGVPVKISLSQNFYEVYNKAFLMRENKMQ